MKFTQRWEKCEASEYTGNSTAKVTLKQNSSRNQSKILKHKKLYNTKFASK